MCVSGYVCVCEGGRSGLSKCEELEQRHREIEREERDGSKYVCVVYI